MMARPEIDRGFCNCFGFDNPDWPGPWGCDRVWWEVADGVMITHRCVLSYDHTHYRDEPHVCAEGHRCDVEKPRRRWWDWLLRRPVEELPRRRDQWFGMTLPPQIRAVGRQANADPGSAVQPLPNPDRPSAPPERS